MTVRRGMALLWALWLLCAAALAAPIQLTLNGSSTPLDGFVYQDQLYVALIPFLQAIGGGARPVRVDIAANVIVLTKGDGSTQVSVSTQLKDAQIYIAALAAARGLGFEASFKDNILTLKPQAASAPNTPLQASSLYPRDFDPKQFEGVASAIYNELEGNAPSSPNLEALLNLAGVPVFGTPDQPADADQLEIYQALHHPFATALELFTLRAGFQYRLFTPLGDFFTGLGERGVTAGGAKLEPNGAPGLVAKLFAGPPSRSQVVFALVGAMGRERARRGISLSHKLDSFWGDDALDPVQVRLLDAVLTTGPGPESVVRHQLQRGPSPVNLAPGHSALPLNWPLALPALPGQTLERAQRGGEVLVIQTMASDLAEKTVSTIVKETYPEGKNWLDNQVQDAMGIPIVLPISPELLEAVLKGDTGTAGKLWGGLLKTAGIETAKEGARLALCGSLTLYGYETRFTADPLEIHHSTANEAEGKALSKLKVTLSFKDDYRSKVFKTPVRFAARLAVKDPPQNAAELLERLGCQIPEPGPGKGKGVEWELTGDLPDHVTNGQVEFPDAATNAAGEARAQLRAVEEHTPKAFRLTSRSTTGVLFVRLLDLLPHKYWRIQAAAQMGQDAQDGNSAGTGTQRLHIKYFEPPKLLLKFKSTINANEKGNLFHFVMESDVQLEPKFNGDPNDPRSKFLGYEGQDRIRYLEHSLKSDCAKMADVRAGDVSVWVAAENFENPQITVVMNSLVNPPMEFYVATGNCRNQGWSPGWQGFLIAMHNADGDFGSFEGTQAGSVAHVGLIARAPRQEKQVVFYRKTFQHAGFKPAPDLSLDENTEVTLEVAGN